MLVCCLHWIVGSREEAFAPTFSNFSPGKESAMNPLPDHKSDSKLATIFSKIEETFNPETLTFPASCNEMQMLNILILAGRRKTEQDRSFRMTHGALAPVISWSIPPAPLATSENSFCKVVRKDCLCLCLLFLLFLKQIICSTEGGGIPER